jgi:hypothetical protein
MKKLNPEDYIGKKYGRLTIISFEGRDKNSHIIVKCRCDCGNEYISQFRTIKDGMTKSCGCLKAESNKIKLRDTFDKRYITYISSNKTQSNNQSGVRGVSFCPQSGGWLAQITINNKVHRKHFMSKQDAIDYRKELEETYFKPIINEYKANLDNQTTK